jgi:hypothetical protein
VTRPSEAPRSGGGLASIDEHRRNVFNKYYYSCLQNNRLVRARTVRCFVELETGEYEIEIIRAMYWEVDVGNICRRKAVYSTAPRAIS